MIEATRFQRGHMDNIPELNVNVGQHIRSLRERQGLSLRALAERCGLSITAISQIERGENSPTVSSLHMLASALDVSIIDLFQDNHQSTAVFVRLYDRLRAESSGVLMESLGIGLPFQQLEPFIVTLNPRAGNANQPAAHKGEEFVLCLDGEFEYCVDGRIYRMEPGTSLIFQAHRPHYFHNPTTHPVRFLLVFQAGGVSARQIHIEMARRQATAIES
jgi:transcriptional regulator with XRE-family HTH domain